MQRLVALVFVLYFTCVLTQNVGSKTGPCDATYIPPPDKPLTIYDSTEGAQSMNYPCGYSYSYAPIVWYKIYTPLGTNITLSTCGLGTNFDTMIFVFTGNCSSLSCLTYNDQAYCSINHAPGNTSSLSNTSTLSFNGTDSFVFIGVGGYYYSSGDYQLTITVVNYTSSDNGPATNNNNFGCQNATNIYGPYSPELTVFAKNINATTGFTGFNSTTCAITSNQYSVWYKIFPVIGERLNITTCNSATDFDTIISVFSGSSCSSLSCTARSDDSCVGYRSTASSVSFIPTSSSYYVVVSGYNSAYGTYELSISQETTESSSTPCANAELITLGTVYNSSLVGAPLLVNNSCAIFANRSANWYELTLSYSKNVSASTCFPSTNFDTALLVFSGSCSNLSCVGYNDDAPCIGSSSVSSTISFTAYANITYYIAVANYTTLSGTAGIYSLRVV